ncbi:protein TRC8 homolog [Cyanistes caeruleus]|uniref:protein TRC8 homolog n=1 Tax=Cyanistes caeruleus TaxID=156563 RepID=UPI000CDB98D0|nr:protein TRC8 homolog [Cyanistes caeruleus]XP_023774342.1 protein TRC8 homolog [Cyanistes caeruleus]XP_023774343.1 protein TRC8 homolog [Cyanistes caeruleus]
MSRLPPAGPSETAAAEGLCPICLSDLENATCVEVCRHRFCFVCIREWAKLTESCPLCKQPFKRLLCTAGSSHKEQAAARPARRQRQAARIRSRSPQQHNSLSRRRADTQRSPGRRGTEGTHRVQREPVAVLSCDATSQQAAAASTSHEGTPPSAREHLASPAATPDRAASDPTTI